MDTTTVGVFEVIEDWSPNLFLIAGMFLLITALNRGIAFLFEGYAFNDWIGLAALLGRLAVLLGIVGLSVQVTNRNSRLGKLTLGAAILAAAFTTGLLTLAVLENAGFTTDIIAVFGLGTFLLSVIAFLVVGMTIIRTDAYSRPVGYLLLVGAIALLVVFFGQLVVPEDIVGTVIEAVLFLLYVGLGYLLITQSAPINRQETTEPSA